MMDLQSVVYEIGERNPLQRKNILTAMHVLTQEEISEANRELSFFKEKMGYTRDEIVAAYLWFIDTFMSAQIDFSRTGRYQHSTFAEIEHYYKDEQLMRDYVASLAVTLYLFPQHIETMRFYKSSIAPPPPPPRKHMTLKKGLSAGATLR